MIRINLLPQDFRRKESTPFAVLGPMLACIVVTLGAGFAWAWLHFAELNTQLDRLSELTQVLQSKARGVAYVGALKGEQDDFALRKQTIQEIAGSRMLWTKKLDQFFNVATSDEDGQQYLIWLNTLEVKPPPGTGGSNKNPVGETVSMKGYCLAEQNPLQHYNTFHAAIRNSEFFTDFVSLDDPSGKSVEFDDGMQPSSAWDIDLSMIMKPRELPKGKKAAQPPTNRIAEAGSKK